MKKWNRMLAGCVALAALFAFAACAPQEGPPPKPAGAKEIALEYAGLVYDKYWVDFGDGDSYFLENYPTKSGEASRAYLWSHFAALGMQYRICKLAPDDETQLARYRAMLDALKYYKNSASNESFAKYNSGRGEYPNYGNGDIFFDDNIWVARNLLFAYDVFGEEWYLNEAKLVTNFIYTGWNNEIEGLVWNERGLTDNATAQELERGLSANACGIIVNAELYRLTGEESYLTWAKKFYDFCKKVQDPETYIYYNGIHTIIESDGTRTNGSVNKALYGYNPGSMIIADLLLYELTEDESYLTDAKRSAAAADKAFRILDLGSDVEYYKDFVWFSAIYMESLYALKSYDSALAEPFIEVFRSSIAYAREHYPNEEGFLPHDYAAGFITAGSDVNDRSLLTQSGTAEIMALLALCEA